MKKSSIAHTQVPPYQTKAEFFRMLGHPVRIRVLELLGEGPRPVDVVLLRLSRVTAIDASGALALREAVEDLHHRTIAVHASGIRPEHRRALASLGVLALPQERVHVDAPAAFAALRAPAAPPRAGQVPRQVHR